MYVEDQKYLMIQEYGYHLYGWLPTGEVTGIVHSRGQFVPSHIREYTDYTETPLETAMERYVTGRKDEMKVEDHRYWNPETEEEYFHESGKLASALRGIPVLMMDSKSQFKKDVLRGEIHLGDTPAIFNRYGDLWVHEDETERVRELFKEYAEEKRVR